jgi:putative nucleotidyltransferase with HDIG domain
MASGRFRIDVFDLIASMARVVDTMSPVVGNHHMQVAYLAYRIAGELGLPEDDRHQLVVAGALHDIGAFSLQERLDLLEFEDTKPGEHSLAGYLLLKNFKPFLPIATMVRYHHVPWEDGKGATQDGETVPEGSQIIHLADRVAVKISKDEPVLSQVQDICEAIAQRKNEVFVPEHVDAMLALSRRDYIWLEVTSNHIEQVLRSSTSRQTRELNLDEFLDFCWLICRLIDFKSEFTATHSSGVAATAVAIAKLAGFSHHERKLMEIAGLLHDIGKLSTPSEILEKPGKLTDYEWFIMRSHVFHTYQILEPVEALEVVNSWGALHQERLDGTGYPFGYTKEELPFGSRIMAVADVFTALTEDRPYRKGMGKEKTLRILQKLVDSGGLDEKLVDIVFDRFDEMNEARHSAQQKAMREYAEFRAALNK